MTMNSIRFGAAYALTTRPQAEKKAGELLKAGEAVRLNEVTRADEGDEVLGYLVTTGAERAELDTRERHLKEAKGKEQWLEALDALRNTARYYFNKPTA